MKKILTALFTVAMMSHLSFGSLVWGTDGSILNFNGQPVPSSSEELAPFIPQDPTVGAFAQLIRILSGNQPFSFVNSGSGISVGNEQVVDTMYSGQWDDIMETPGAFPYSINSLLNGSQFNGFYYVRVFDAPQASAAAFNLGNAAPIPAGAQYFYQSSVLNYTHNDLAQTVWDFTGALGGQTLNAVPEPGTVLLMARGLVGLFVHRRRVA
ncbi:MAG TPA: PEP-CTERM sorting domain-containing protein [Kiritimatiellia bacterium]|nr:PEP-CTERM sorting domain-containing protein [Kiritimatiellia bacterium]